MERPSVRQVSLNIGTNDVGDFDLAVLNRGHKLRCIQIRGRRAPAGLHGHIHQHDRAYDYYPKHRGLYICTHEFTFCWLASRQPDACVRSNLL